MNKRQKKKAENKLHLVEGSYKKDREYLRIEQEKYNLWRRNVRSGKNDNDTQMLLEMGIYTADEVAEMKQIARKSTKISRRKIRKCQQKQNEKIIKKKLQEERVDNFIYAADGEELCGFCILRDECPKCLVCYGGEPIEPPCTDLADEWVDAYIDKEAIADYLDGLEE